MMGVDNINVLRELKEISALFQENKKLFQKSPLRDVSQNDRPS